MATHIKTKSVRITSPKGTAVYPWVNEPDRRFDSTGVFTCTLRLDGSDNETKKFIDAIKKVASTHFDVVKGELKKAPKKADLPIKPVLDEEGNETGEIDIKFKLKSQGGTGDKTWTQRPALFDSKGNSMKEKVGGGSVVKIGCEVSPFYTPTLGVGVTLRLKAVQVLELREFGGSSAESWFTKEDGFEAAPPEAASVSSTDSEQDSEDGAGF